MATIRASASDTPLKINHEGSTHELIITARGGIDPEQLKQVIAKTIITWMKAYTAITNTTYLMPEGSKSACEAIGVTPHDIEPHCTVWNKTYRGASLTVHSNGDGQNAVDAYGAIVSATDWLKDNVSYLFEGVNNSSLHLQSPSNSNAAPVVQTTISPFVRSTQSPFKVSGQVIPNTVGIEGGKTATPNWNKPGTIATSPYINSASGFDTNQIVLYRLDSRNDNVQVREHNGKLLLSFKLMGGDDIAVWEKEDFTTKEGKVIPSPWSIALEKLGLATVAQGQFFELKADYIAMKAGNPYTNKQGEIVQYWDFYGFFDAPVSEDSAGKQELDEHFDTQNDRQSKYEASGDSPRAAADYRDEYPEHYSDDIPF